MSNGERSRAIAASLTSRARDGSGCSLLGAALNGLVLQVLVSIKKGSK
jgi:hypothetical protein